MSWFIFAYLYELICNAKLNQRFKGTLQFDWLVTWSPDRVFVQFFKHLPMYLGEQFLVGGVVHIIFVFGCLCAPLKMFCVVELRTQTRFILSTL